MPHERIDDYPEVRRYHKSSKDIGLRVQLPFNEFKEADKNQQINMVLHWFAQLILRAE